MAIETAEVIGIDKAFKPLNQTGIKSLNNNIKTTIALVPKSVNQFKQKERTLKALRNEVKIGGTEFKKLGAESVTFTIETGNWHQKTAKEFFAR